MAFSKIEFKKRCKRKLQEHIRIRKDKGNDTKNEERMLKLVHGT